MPVYPGAHTGRLVGTDSPDGVSQFRAVKQVVSSE
jgi:hypothetical protein